jgi:predicted RNA-binding Zn ribbon-like protein
VEEERHNHTFDLSGGALCLDFANTWSDRGRPETDHLRDYRDLLAFAQQTGLLSAAEEARLAGRAETDPQAASAALARSRGLREDLYRLFSAFAAGRAPAGGDLEQLNTALPEAYSRLRLERRGDDLVWAWAAPDGDLAAPLWPVLRSAAELLTSGERELVRECAGSACTWLFLDRSRNRSRRWCSMETCGNRAKAQRHYRRRSETEREAEPD